MESRLVEFLRISEDTGYFEMKDPSLVPMPDGTFMMYAGLGTVRGEEWVQGRFRADHPGGPWQELEPAVIEGVTGTEVCAPVVLYAEKDGKPLWRMYVQTACFSEGGVIALATSEDGIHFRGSALPAMTRDDIPQEHQPVVGLYDVNISDVAIDGIAHECMVFSGYRKVGSGDIYMSLRKKDEEKWSQPRLMLRQEDVPFHNRPGIPNFEWGLEGAKVLQLADDAFLMVGVSFLDKGNECRGTRQRVFFAAARSVNGPFIAMNTPIDPTVYDVGQGENGHPDMAVLGKRFCILYQERAGEGHPWHLRYAEIDKEELLCRVRTHLLAHENPPETLPPSTRCGPGPGPG